MFEFRDEHLGRLLQSVYRDFNSRALTKMRKLGYKDLTQFQAELIGYMELDGTRVKALTLKPVWASSFFWMLIESRLN
jgi:hypothetical protein